MRMNMKYTSYVDDAKEDARGDSPTAFSFVHWRDLPQIPPDAPVPAASEETPVGYLERGLALVLLIAVTPLMILIAVVLKITSPAAPVFYLQERVGLDRRQPRPPDDRYTGSDRRRNSAPGQLFRICKFRTMVPNAERLTGPVWASQRDPRITRVGGVLRKLRFDELPQLGNVVRGQMRLIGPRPERPHFVGELSKAIPDYLLRLTVPPGITGLAQVEKEYDTSVDDVRAKLKYDLFYVRNRCRLLDIKILLRTVDVMVRGRGAH
jgi:lipopolysaccharide/colanic/teichoic acid biosynthesis glycosyltransferase